MKNYFFQIYIVVLLLILPFVSCKKDWLSEKPNSSIVIPNTIQDFQAVLDNTDAGNAPFNANAPGLGEVSTTDYFLTDTRWQSRYIVDKNAYIWADDVFVDQQGSEWNVPYQRILTENIVLEGIEKISPAASELPNWNNVKGSALFFRALDYYGLSQIFCKPYNPGTANADLGLPIRTSSDINKNIERTDLQATYNQIISDLSAAGGFLPTLPAVKTRPSKAAVFALFARIYLSMEDYPKAKRYADSALAISNTIIDYNSLNPAAAFPLSRFNDEVIFHNTLLSYGSTNLNFGFVDKQLYSSYAANDLRKVLYFRTSNAADTSYIFRGNYNGAIVPLFNGLATDELYLIRAECNARIGDKDAALADLNALMQKRWKNTVVYPTITATDGIDALKKILTERRKELMMRGVRWSDLRRLNKDPQFAITLSRFVNGQSYSLPPNNPKYTFLIPQTELNLSGIQQNPR